MITSLNVQRAVIAWIKSNTPTVALLSSADEVRENEWQGNVFVYPNIRIKVLDLSNLLQNRCDVTSAPVDVIINSNQPSSLQAETIADTFITQINNKTFTQNGVQFISIKVKQTPSYRVESEGIWRIVVHLQLVVS